MDTLSCRLQELQRCAAQQLISQDEHAEAKRKLLEGFCSLDTSPPSPATFGQAKYDRASGLASPDAAGSDASTLRFRTHSHWSLPSPHIQQQRSQKDFRRSDGTMEYSPIAADTSRNDTSEEEEGQYWVRHITDYSERPSGDLAPRTKLRLDRITMADIEQYNMTSGRVHEIFADFDADKNGEISVEELTEGLKRLDIYLSSEAVKKLILYVLRRCGRQIGTGDVAVREKEFRVMLSRLRLAELFTPTAGAIQFSEYNDEIRSACPMMICNYSRHWPTETVRWELGSSEQTKEAQRFFFGSRRLRVDPQTGAPARDVRWVHVDGSAGLDRLTLLRLAVKYHLHPLAIDDIIDNRTPTKLDRFAEYYFVSVDVLTLVNATASPEKRVLIHRSNVSIFLSLPPYSDTILTILQDRPDESSWMSLWRKNHGISIVPDYSLWEELRDHLEDSKSRRLRAQKADFFLYEVLDRVVDLLRPITQAYAARLGFMNQHSGWLFPQAWLDELAEVRLELFDLARSIRPMRQVLRHLLDDTELSFQKMYLEDVEDTIVQTLEDILQLQEMGKALEDAHDKHIDKRMNSTLYRLSVMSAIFFPCTFVTGLYGMNFVDQDGKPGIPELTWDQGYLYFWKLEFALLFIASAGFFLLEYGSAEQCREGFHWLCHRCCASRSRDLSLRVRLRPME